MNARRPIMGNGEALTTAVDRKYGGGASTPPKPYERARQDALSYAARIKEEFSAIPENMRHEDELFYCLRIHPEALAKSFDFSSFIRASGMARIGTRAWKIAPSDVTQTERLRNKVAKGANEFTAKTIFVRSHISALDRVMMLLDEAEGALPKSFIDDICRLENINLLSDTERIMGFNPDWSKGKIEIVLHPSEGDQEGLVQQFMELAEKGGIAASSIKAKVYPSNLAFVSMSATPAVMDAIKTYNPLRAVRPLEIRAYPSVRNQGGAGIPAPLPPEITEKSSIKVGIFDGGVKEDHPLLNSFCNETSNPAVKSQPVSDAVAHGTAVAGAVLYGSLNHHAQGVPLPTPNVSVESFRVFPLEDDLDIDLYEAIDLIEDVVPGRPDISVYNLSFGPHGPILDDDLSRFSYSLDYMAHLHNVLFVVACGNDGNCTPPYNRIQSPSDIVNGLGIGAHDDDSRATYSCVGPGREGAKTKPDVLAFGGSDNNPIHLLSLDSGQRALSQGTSFSAPIVSGIAAQLIGLTDRVSPLVARALIIHNAEHPEGLRCFDYGYGCVSNDIESYLNCSEKSATVLFQGAIAPKQNIRLPIPIPESVQLSGMVTLSWTIAIESAVNDLDTLEYTSHCIEESFYPNGNLYRFSDPVTGNSQYVDIAQDAQLARQLISYGWGKSSLPKSNSGSQAGTEATLRKTNLKWDTMIKSSVRKRASSLQNPMLVLHAMSRNGVSVPVRYGAVVTISAPSYSGDIYNDIATHIPQLVPVRVRAENEIRIRS